MGKLKETLKFYSSLFNDWFTGGFFQNREAISSIGIKPTYKSILTEKYIKRVIWICAFPTDYEDCFSHAISLKAREACLTCKTIVSMNIFPNNISLRDSATRRNFRTANRDYNRYADIFAQLEDADKQIGYEFRDPNGRKIRITPERLKDIKDKYDSYAYVFETIKNGGTLAKSYLSVEIMTETEEEMNKVMKAVLQYLEGSEIEYTLPQKSLAYYLNNYAPAGVLNEKDIRKGYVDMYLSDENLALLQPFKSRGLVGDGRGTPIGFNTESMNPQTINFFESGQAQVSMICAPSGKGKTFLAFQLALGLLNSHHHVSVIDIKGNEWCKLGQFVPYTIVSIGTRNPRIPNILRLDDVMVDKTNASEFYRMAFTGFAQLTKLLCNFDDKLDRHSIADLGTIINTALRKLYSQRGVRVDNPLSFKNTEGIKYEDILPVLAELRNSFSYTAQQKELITLIISRTEQFFKGEGDYEGMLDNEITLGEILDYPLVIYSLDKNEDRSTTTLDSIKSFLIQFLDMKKQMSRKRLGKHTACFYEELQRKNEFRELMKFISQVVTGSRSSNVIVFLLFNSLSIVERDMSNRDEEFEKIVSNINHYFIGGLSKSDRKILHENLDCEDIEELVEEISKHKSSGDQDLLANNFAVKFDTGKSSGVVRIKSIVPEDRVHIFETRDKEK